MSRRIVRTVTSRRAARSGPVHTARDYSAARTARRRSVVSTTSTQFGLDEDSFGPHRGVRCAHEDLEPRPGRTARLALDDTRPAPPRGADRRRIPVGAGGGCVEHPARADARDQAGGAGSDAVIDFDFPEPRRRRSRRSPGGWATSRSACSVPEPPTTSVSPARIGVRDDRVAARRRRRWARAAGPHVHGVDRGRPLARRGRAWPARVDPPRAPTPTVAARRRWCSTSIERRSTTCAEISPAAATCTPSRSTLAGGAAMSAADADHLDPGRDRLRDPHALVRFRAQAFGFEIEDHHDHGGAACIAAGLHRRSPTPIEIDGRKAFDDAGGVPPSASGRLPRLLFQTGARAEDGQGPDPPRRARARRRPGRRRRRRSAGPRAQRKLWDGSAGPAEVGDLRRP